MAYYNYAETIKQKKPSDLNQLARAIVDDVRDECAPDQFSEEEPSKQPTHQKNPAAVALRKLDGKNSGPACAKELSPELVHDRRLALLVSYCSQDYISALRSTSKDERIWLHTGTTAMAKWKKKTLKLKDTHGWKARPGCRIFVADKGAVRFDFPMHWIMEPTADCVQFHDRQPPTDDCRLAVSYQRLPAIDWSEAPLADMLREVVEKDPRVLTPTMEVRSIRRPDLHLVWVEGNFIDPQEFRQAYGRIAVGIGGNIQVLLTYDYWADDAERFAPVWDDVLQSLQVGAYIPDPTRGPRL